MKKTFLLLLCIAISASVSFSQNTQRGFSFQGIARDLNGKALGATSVEVKFSVLQSNVVVFTEQQPAVTTDAFGVFSLTIGSANPTDFEKVDFSKDSKLKVEVFANNAWGLLSLTDLQSVPVAKYAERASFPAGTMIAFAGPKTNIPSGWIVCEGQAVSRTTYPELFAAIGNSWGSGDGATTFNLPYTQGQFLRGVNSGTSQDPDAASRTAIATGGNVGDNVGSAEGDLFGSHNHDGATGVAGAHTHAEKGFSLKSIDYKGGGSASAGNGTGDEIDRTTGSAGVHSHTISADGGSETRPKNVYVYYIIKY